MVVQAKDTSFLVRIPSDLLASVDAAAGPRGRSKFVRSALERAVGTPVTEEPNPDPKAQEPEAIAPSVSGDSDASILLGEIWRGQESERDLAHRLGWNMGRVTKAAKILADQRKAVFAGGTLRAL